MVCAVLLLGLTLPRCGGDGVGGGWSRVSDAPFTTAMDVWSFSEDETWFVDGGPNIHRFDGSDWSLIETKGTRGLSCIFALSPSEVWLCAGDKIVKYDGASFTPLDVKAATGLSDVVDIWAVGRQLGEGGSKGLVLRR